MGDLAYIRRRITTDLGVNVTSLFWIIPTTDPITLRLYNDDTRNTTANYIAACRGDLLESGLTIPGQDTTVSNGLGEELVSELWLEARVGIAGTWTPVDSWANKLDLGAIAAGDYTTFQVRLNAPSGFSSRGMVSFSIRVATPL